MLLLGKAKTSHQEPIVKLAGVLREIGMQEHAAQLLLKVEVIDR
jgi:hypothetical protein